jgi:serine kinase of HPr protein (carbohydrate metabolism regulator)
MSRASSVAGTCVALPSDGVFKGVLLRGAPGAGKSDLALRLIDGGGRLVADDRVLVNAEAGQAIARAPQAICGWMEVRGLGIVAVARADSVPLALLVDLVPHAEVPRCPEPAFESVGGVSLPRVKLCPFEASAAAKIRLAVQALSAGAKAGVTFPFASG